MTAQPILTPLQRRVDAITAEVQKAVAEAQKATAMARQAAEETRRLDPHVAMQGLRDMMFAVIGSWRRICFICGCNGWCEHREPELVSRWEAGGLR